MKCITLSPTLSRSRYAHRIPGNRAFAAMSLLVVAMPCAFSQSAVEQLKQNLGKARDQVKQAVKQAQQPAAAAQSQPAQNQSADATAPPGPGAAAPASDPASQSGSGGASSLGGLLNGTTSQPPSASSNLPPVPLPEIEGIRLGMSFKDATAALQKAYPGAHQSSGTNTLPMSASPFITGFGVGLEIGSPLSDKVVVNLTPPPDNQVVYSVWRYVNNQHLDRGNLIAALRKKYGPETARFVGSSQTDETHATEFVWLFDQNGHPAPLPNSSDASATINDCSAMFGVGALSVPAFSASNLTTDANRQLIQPGGWCNSSMIGLIASIAPAEILTVYSEHLVDIPSLTQSARDELTAIDNYAQQQKKKAIQSAKQQQPTL